MKSQRKTPKQRTDMIPVGYFLSRVRSFFEGIGPHRMELLVAGNPDQATEALLAELLLDLIVTCVQSVLQHFSRTHTQMLEEDMEAAVAEVLFRSFSEAPDDPISGFAENLAELVMKEVMETLRSSREDFPTRITPPQQVDSLVKEAIRTIQSSTSGTSGKSKSHPSTESPKSVESAEMSELSSLNSTDSLETSIKEVVHSTLRRLVDEMTGPLAQTLMYDSHQEMEKHISEETEKISSQLSSVLEEQLSSPAKPPSVEQEEVLQKGVAGKVKTFFAKVFAKVLMFRTWGRFEKKAHKDLKERSKEATDILLEAVESLLEVREETEEEEEVCFLNIPEGKTLHITKALADILYQSSTEKVPPQLPTSDRRYAAIQQRVILFLTLVRWWMSTQLEPHSRQVLRALTDRLSRLSHHISEETEEISTPELTSEIVLEMTEDVKKVHVAVMVKRILARLLRKAKLDFSYMDIEARYGWIIEDVWSHMKDDDISVMLENPEKLQKSVAKDLVKWFGDIQAVLVLLDKQAPQIPDCIIVSIRSNLWRKRPAICRFFCFLGKALIRPFRRDHSLSSLWTGPA